jgi:3-deoxy-manno-octulosonate cytidylyltransferase (CMP-KDO synthetase)
MAEKILCVIPARYQSSRLPGKPLALIKGLPLVMWAYRRAAEADAFDRVLVATDDERIHDAVRAHGGDALMSSVDHATGADRVAEVSERMPEFGFVVNLQGDEPDIPAALLEEFARELVSIDDNCLLTCVSNATMEEVSDPNAVKAVLAADRRALYFSRAPIPYNRDKDGGVWYRHTGIYGFTRISLQTFRRLPHGRLEQIENLEQLRALEAGMSIRCILRDCPRCGIDTPEDLQRFRMEKGDHG